MLDKIIQRLLETKSSSSLAHSFVSEKNTDIEAIYSLKIGSNIENLPKQYILEHKFFDIKIVFNFSVNKMNQITHLSCTAFKNNIDIIKTFIINTNSIKINEIVFFDHMEEIMNKSIPY